MTTMNTVALELVPPDLDDGEERAIEEGRRAAGNARAAGLGERIQHVLIPGMIPEEDDRPVKIVPKMDPLDFWQLIGPEMGDGVRGLCTQVTAFLDEQKLGERLDRLRAAGMDGVVFVGVPRTMADGEGPGVPPIDALSMFQGSVDNRGVILIPTREGEPGRFGFKCNSGATFALTQLLYSDAIVGFLGEFAKQHDHRPELLLSFGFVPGAESRVRLIDWLIQDPGNPAVEQEQQFVARLAESPFAQRKRELVDLYKRVVDGAGELGFPLSIHLEAPYGPSAAAFETFAEMLDHWSPS